LNSLVRHADRVTMANQAQLVNVIAPIRTEPDADAWRQTIFWPFAVTAARARGAALRVAAECPTVPTDAYGDVPVVDVAATTAGDRVEVFCVNRDPENPVEVTLAGAHGALRGAHDAVVLTVPEGHDRFVTNTRDAQPVGLRELDVRVEDGEVRLTLPALSWAALGVVPAGGSVLADPGARLLHDVAQDLARAARQRRVVAHAGRQQHDVGPGRGEDAGAQLGLGR